jgi:hypothetical protein
MTKKMSQQSIDPNIVKETTETTTGASDDSTDVDIYLEETTEIVELPPRATQRSASLSLRSKAPKRATAAAAASIEKEWNDANADHDRKYDLTPLGEKNANRRTPPSYSTIDPWEVAHAKEIARAEKEQEAADGDEEG